MFSNLIKYKYLIVSMIRREIEAKYRDSLLGIFWSFLVPLILLGVYTVFFSYIFKSKWGGEQVQSQAAYPIVLFVGLTIHTLFSDIVSRSPGLVLSYGYLVKKTAFPLDILAWVSIGQTLFQVLINVLIILAMNFFIYKDFSWTCIFIPIVLAPLCILLMAMSWFLACIGVYVRDITQLSNLFITILMFLSPVFFPLSYLPEPYKSIAYINPLTLIIEESRKVLLYNSYPNFAGLSIYFFISIILMWLSHMFFMKMKRNFSDVL